MAAAYGQTEFAAASEKGSSVLSIPRHVLSRESQAVQNEEFSNGVEFYDEKDQPA
jgi:hypothetical protein